MRNRRGNCQLTKHRTPNQVCRWNWQPGIRHLTILRSGSAVSLKASLTVECAMVLPLFFMVCLTLICFMNAIKLQVKTSLELSNTARNMSMAAGAAQGGARLQSWIDLAENKEFSYPFSLPGIPKLKVAVRARVYPWTGIKGGLGNSGNGSSSTGNEMVLVTENKEVWHSHTDCTHLDLAVFQSTTSNVKRLRNAYGKKYKKCPGFPDGYTGVVYVTAKGDYYYPSASYGSLTRHVRMVRKSSVPNLHECERCAARDAKGDPHDTGLEMGDAS